MLKATSQLCAHARTHVTIGILIALVSATGLTAHAGKSNEELQYDMADYLCKLEPPNLSDKQSFSVTPDQYISALLTVFNPEMDYSLIMVPDVKENVPEACIGKKPSVLQHDPNKISGFTVVAKTCGFRKTLKDALTVSDEELARKYCVQPTDKTISDKDNPAKQGFCNSLPEMRKYIGNEFYYDANEISGGYDPRKWVGNYRINGLENEKNQSNKMLAEARNINTEERAGVDEKADFLLNMTEIKIYCGNRPTNLTPSFPEGYRLRSTAANVAYDLKTEDHNYKLDNAETASIEFSFQHTRNSFNETDDDGKLKEDEENDDITVNLAFGKRIQSKVPVFGTLRDLDTTFYTELDYNRDDNLKKETDNWSFGVNLALPLKANNENLQPAVPRIDLAWITDFEQRESQQWRIVTRQNLPFVHNALPDTPYFSADYYLDLIADYNHVIDAGDKYKLVGKGEYARIGTEFSANVSSNLVQLFGWKPNISGSLLFLETVSDDDANVTLGTLETTLAESDNKQVQFILEWSKGRNAVSLESEEDTKLKMKLKY